MTELRTKKYFGEKNYAHLSTSKGGMCYRQTIDFCWYTI